MKLVYINGLGSNFRGNYVYEFIFSSNLTDIWGPDWDSVPALGKPLPPDIEYIEKVGVLSKEGLEFELVQNSDYFSFTDAIDDVIALGWEKYDEENMDSSRLVFRFGETIESVTDKLYSRDLILTTNETEKHEKI
jgi:hypothetical protein